VPRAEQHREIGSDAYHGGAVTEERASIHPGLYQLGLLDRACAAGVRVLAGTPVTGLQADGAGVRVATARGTMAARNVLVATNGYTGPATPWLRRRVVPFHGFMIATEALPEATIDKVLPRPRIVQDYNVNIFFVRRAPDGRRILFGGYTGGPARDLRAKAARLHAEMVRLFPDLAGARLSHAWSGKCAATFDYLPHIGVRDGVHHALGYSYTGVPMGTWLGRKAALQILGDRDGATAFDGQPFPTAPLYTGNPWFVPLAMAYYDWQDRRGL
jgi:glycine/D-amino acid oxidase-like deaminating enzyme